MSVTNLNSIRPLTNNEYDKARDEAIKRVKNRAGEKPTRAMFERDYGPLWSSIDYIAMLVGVSAWLVSSAHILNHAGAVAAASYTNTVEASSVAGVTLNQMLYGIIHQAGFIVLAESAMILFMVMHSSRVVRAVLPDEHPLLYRLRTVPSIPLLLAGMAALFVFVANWQSGIGVLESILPPAVTIGLGVYFEGRIAEGFRRRQEVTTRYLVAVDDYEAAQQNPEAASEFPKLLRQAIAYALQNKRANKKIDIPVETLKLAVVRELERERWALEWDDAALVQQYHATLVGETRAEGVTYDVAAEGQVQLPGFSSDAVPAVPNGNGSIAGAGTGH